MGNLYTHDPDENITYTVDFSQFLAAGETLVTASIVLEDGAGLTATEPVLEGAQATFQVSGVELGRHYRVTVRGQTSTGQTPDRSIHLLGRQH